MRKILVPVDGSSSALHAVRHAIAEADKAGSIEVQLLYVQAPLPLHIGQFLSAAHRRAFHDERAEQALQPARDLLERAGVLFRVSTATGEKCAVIADFARRCGCHAVVLCTRRKSALLRMIENSTVNGVIERAPVPVVIIAGEPVSRVERYGVPAGAGAALASLLFAAAE